MNNNMNINRNQPLVSIVAPMFNVEKYIERFINCIINQTYLNWELILVDDGSNDSTVFIANNYATKDNRIKVFIRNRLPKNADTCRNIGQSHVKGKYMLVFDSDDIIEPFCLNQRVDYMENNPDIDYSTFLCESVKFSHEKSMIRTGIFWGIPTNDDLLQRFLMVNYPFTVWSNIYRSDSFKNQKWDEKVRVYQDYDFLVQSLFGNYKHSFSKNIKPDYLYCINENSTSSSFVSDEKLESTIYLFTKIINQLKEQNNYIKYRKCFRTFFLLQYKRLFTNGNLDNFNKFYSFFEMQYPECKYRLNKIHRLLIFFKNSANSKIANKLLDYLFIFVFSPFQIVKNIYGKIKRRSIIYK